MVISEPSAEKLLKEIVYEHKENLKSPEGVITHNENARENARVILKKAFSKYGEIFRPPRIYTPEVIFSSYYHDVGRILTPKENPLQFFHALIGAKYIVENGLDKGIADTKWELYRISNMIRSHGNELEWFLLPELEEKKGEFSNTDPDLLRPIRWDQAIVAYSELSVDAKGNRVGMKERMEEIIDRYEKIESEDGKNFVKGVKNGLGRMLALEDRIIKLEKGRLSEKEIMMYVN